MRGGNTTVDFAPRGNPYNEMTTDSEGCCKSSECSCSYAGSTSSSSISSSSDSSSEKPPPANKNPNFNYDYCTCQAPLPKEYAATEPTKKKTKFRGPAAGLWCGSPSCTLVDYFPIESKKVARNPIKFAPESKSIDIQPGACCYKDSQLIFQIPDKAKKRDVKSVPLYNIGQDDQPLGVKMIKPEENPELDPDNNTYIMTITKTDRDGKPAKLQLALKFPRAPDTSVSETEHYVQYDPADYQEEESKETKSVKSLSKGEKGGKGKGKGDAKGKKGKKK